MSTLWTAIVWIHLLAMAFFVGGQLLLAVAVVPVERSAPDRERLRAVARRFGYGTLVAIVVLLITGVAMASHFQLWGEATLHVKLALIALVAVLLGVHMRHPTAHALQAVVFVLSLAIVWLGVSLGH